MDDTGDAWQKGHTGWGKAYDDTYPIPAFNFVHCCGANLRVLNIPA